MFTRCQLWMFPGANEHTFTFTIQDQTKPGPFSMSGIWLKLYIRLLTSSPVWHLKLNACNSVLQHCNCIVVFCCCFDHNTPCLCFFSVVWLQWPWPGRKQKRTNCPSEVHSAWRGVWAAVGQNELRFSRTSRPQPGSVLCSWASLMPLYIIKLEITFFLLWYNLVEEKYVTLI